MEKFNLDIIDCFGEMCPVPVMRAREKLRDCKIGESFVLVSDHSCVVESMRDNLKNQAELEVDEVMNGVYEIKITRIK